MPHKNSKSYTDYRTLPYNLRPLAMRILEQSLGQPLDQAIRIVWSKTPNIESIGKTLGLEPTRIRTWMRGLGLFICIKCSVKEKRLFDHTSVCKGCGRWFCDECLEDEPWDHMFE